MTNKKKSPTPMEKLTEGYEEFIKDKVVLNSPKDFEAAIKKALKEKNEKKKKK